jgi:hypothetical protein
VLSGPAGPFIGWLIPPNSPTSISVAVVAGSKPGVACELGDVDFVISPWGLGCIPEEETWEGKGLYWKFSGEVTGERILRALLKRDMDCRFRGMSYMIVDFSSVEKYVISVDDTLKVAEYDTELDGLAPGLRIAIVTTRDEILESTELYKQNTVGTSWEVGIFPELSVARNWVTPSSSDL